MRGFLYTLIVVLIAIVSSCGNTQTNTNVKVSAKDSDTNNPSNIQGSGRTNTDFEEFNRRKKEVVARLVSANNQEANELYEKYYRENQKLLTKIIDNRIQILDRFYDDASKQSIKALQDTLSRNSLKFEELGEGYVEITTIPNFYYELFKAYVSADYKAFLFLKSEENKSTYAADAGLVITFRALGDRIISWENFINKYPKSKLIPSVVEDYKHYQKDYIFGLDNTPTGEYYNPDNMHIYEENLAEFHRFMEAHPDSPTVPLIEIFLQNFKESNIYDLINKKQNPK